MRRAFGVMLFTVLIASAGAALPTHFHLAQLGQQLPPPSPPASAGPAQGPTMPQIIQTVSEVDMLLSVVNRRQKFVVDLEQSDFRVLEDNRPQDVKFFTRQTDLPLRVAILLDTSNSIRPRIQFEQDAAIDFIYNCVRAEKDLAFVMTFDSQPDVVLDYTNDVEKLRNTIAAQRAGGGTALYDAITMASEKLMTAPLPKSGPPEMRRILVVISDGDDNLSSHLKSEAIDLAARSNVSIYAISTSTQWLVPEDEQDPNRKFDKKFAKTPGDQVLEAFAGETGGRAFFPYHVEDVAQNFLDIVSELRSQYLLGYTPTNGVVDGKFRKVKIEVVGHKELEVRSRKGYYAVPPIVRVKPVAAPPAH